MSANNTDVKKFIANYQETLNNYSNGIKYYSKNKQIMEYFRKTIISYKDIIKEFQKKLSQLKLNLMKTFYNNENKAYINDNDLYPNLNLYVKHVNNIFKYQIDLFSKEVEDIDNKILSKYKKNESNFANVLNQNKNNLQSEEKKIEKSITEYDNEHKKLMNKYDETEEFLTKYVTNKRENEKKNNTPDKKKNKILDETLNDTLYEEVRYKEIQIKYENNNNYYFKLYDQYMEELEKEILKNSKYFKTDINLFLSIVMDNYNTLNKNFNEYKKTINISEDKETQKENSENINEKDKEKEVKEDFILYKNKNYNQIERKFTKEYYKVRAIDETFIDDGLEKETKIILNNLSEELDLDMHFDENPIVLIEEDVYEITEKFYNYFHFIDRSKYKLDIEKEAIRYKNLTHRLLVFGYKKKKSKEFSHLKELSDDEIKNLLEGLKKKENRWSFLRVLNNFRSLGFYEIPEKEYDIISNGFKIIADSIAESEEIDLKSTRLLLILSQTFFINKDNEKHYLNQDIKDYKLFKIKKFWEIYLKDTIDTETKKVEENKKKNNIKMNEKSYSDIIFAHTLPFSENLTELGMDKDTLMEIITPFYEKYNVPEQMQEIIKETMSKKI